MLTPVRFSGRQFHPDLDSALKAHGLKRKNTESTEEQPTGEEAKPSSRPKVTHIPLPGLQVNYTVYKEGRPYVQVMEAEDQKRYPGVVTLTNDEAGNHLQRISKDLRDQYLAPLMASLALVGLVDGKNRKPDLSGYYKTLDAVWNADELKDDKAILRFQLKRNQEAIQALRDQIDARIEANRRKEEARQNVWYRRLYRWIFRL